MERYYIFCVWFTLTFQFPGLLLDLQILNFNGNHYIYEQAAAALRQILLFEDWWGHVGFQGLHEQTDAKSLKSNTK